jgi:hypothetical protein
VATAAAIGVSAQISGVIALIDRSDPTHPASPASPIARPAPAIATGAPGPIVPMDALAGLLPDAATVNRIEGTTDITQQFGDDPLIPFDVTTNRPECGSIEAPANKTALQGSRYLAVQTQFLRDGHGGVGDEYKHHISNALIYYPTAEAAAAYAAKQAAAWPACTGKSLTAHAAGDPELTIWWPGPVTNHDGILSVINAEEGGAGWACQRALTARNNVVIDTRICITNPTDQAIRFATSIADRVAGAAR